jgi:membrane protease YdiL (CAAX protease family)
MKTAIKLVLIYFLMQVLGVLVAGFFRGTMDMDQAKEIAMAPSMLLGFVFMALYLWWKNYLPGNKCQYSPVPLSFSIWSVVGGFSLVFLVSVLVSQLTFLPNWLADTFNLLQSGWLGILCIALLGPILEELLFRGAITKVLLEKYSPAKAILISGLVFGIFHLNPAQVVNACFLGFFFAWLFYKTKSLLPCILLHVLNNSLAVYLNLKHPEMESDLTISIELLVCLVVFALLLLLSLKKLNDYKISDINETTTTEV